MAYKIHWEPQGVLIEYSGKVSIEDFDQAYAELMTYWEFDLLHYIISNFLAIDEVDFKLNDIDKRVHFMKAMEKSNHHVSFITVSNDNEVQAYAGIIEAELLDCSWACQLFWTMNEARAWLKEHHHAI